VIILNAKITVVVTAYDTEEYLPKCLDSIINQTFKEIEIIVINDGGSLKGLKIINDYAEKDDRIIVHDIENVGVSKARNLGLSKATGDYIIFIDSDDYLALNMLELMYNSITTNHCNMAVCNFIRVFDKKEEPPFLIMPKGKIVSPLMDNAKFIKGFFAESDETGKIGQCVWNKLFKTDFIKNSNILFEDRKVIFAEDALFVYKILPLVGSFSVVDIPLYFYYQRVNSVMNTYKPNLLERVKNLLQEAQKHLEALGIYENVRDGLNIKCFTLFVEVLYNDIDGKKGYKQFAKNCKDEFVKNAVAKIDISNLSINKKLVYHLYKMNLYLLLYMIFALSAKAK